ncbi:hypothetical protein RMN57_36840 [Kitasatospora sp. CM 4170]|uniref:DUF4199 domain-containing protein n=1 Tax=Kitasatospora aburaviensis TaxID=67265 RepID=A0ABW1F8S6_9ACTN|nr:hypothetical protein [Kitasatospora sp. CM 4170]WNM49879.1 hypothetical protein RMN57_36840 [Kitasatospora sp. CM 4170]
MTGDDARSAGGGPAKDEAGARAEGGAGARAAAAGNAGVLGTALGVVLAFSFAQGSWQWFSTYLGVTLLAVVLSFGRVPRRCPGRQPGYAWSLAAYSLVVGLCVALALAPAMQRWDWLFPMPGTRQECLQAGRYGSLQTEAALGGLASQDGAALAYAQHRAGHQAVDVCLSATTTLWLPVYALAAAALTGALGWLWARTRARAAAPAGGATRPE